MDNNTLVIDSMDLTSEDTLTFEEAKDEEIKYCLNCGTEVPENFCPHCGQSVRVPKKLDNKSFGKSIAFSFTRLNSGFGNTLIKLMYKPWEVIRDYIHGKQVNYSHPVTMLIQVALYTAFITIFFEGLLDITLVDKKEVEGANWLIKTMKDSTVIRVLWISIPFIFAAYLAFWNHGSRRFSFSEYVVASLYLLITVRLYSFLIMPVNYIFFAGDLSSDFNIFFILTVGSIFGFITILKAFPIKSRWKRIGIMICFGILALALYFIYTIMFDFLDDWLMGKDMSNWLEQQFSE